MREPDEKRELQRYPNLTTVHVSLRKNPSQETHGTLRETPTQSRPRRQTLPRHGINAVREEVVLNHRDAQDTNGMQIYK